MSRIQIIASVLTLSSTAAFSLTCEQSSLAADVAWSNATGGNFSDGANWNSGSVPLASDNALFDLGSAGYAVDLGANQTTDQLTVSNDTVTLNLGGFTYTQTATGLSNSVVVGQDPGDVGTLTLSNGTIAPANIVIGKTGSTGTLTIAASATVDAGSTVSGSFMIVGDGGTGVVDVTNGGHLIGGAVINSSGTVNITGPGSIWTGSTGGFTTITGALNIIGGGSVTNRSSGVSGTVVVDGQNSTWAMDGPFGGGVLDVGIGTGKNGPLETGTLTIQNGAIVSNKGLLMGVTKSGNGVITVTGAGSTLNTVGGTLVGSNGPGAINILDGATMNSSFSQIAFENSGDVVVDGIGSSWTDLQTIVIGAGDDSSLTVSGGATVTGASLGVGTASDRSDRVNTVDVGGVGSSLTSNFTLSVGSGSPLGSDFTTVTVHDSGSLSVANKMSVSKGTVGFVNGGSGTIGTGALENAANTLRIHADGDVELNTSQFVTAAQTVLNANNIELAGDLAGTGTINGNLNSTGGQVGPGNQIFAGTVGVSAGTLTLNGNYAQDVAGGLMIGLGGTTPGQFDLLNVSGTASLAGTLDVSLLSSFAPALNDTFEILTASGGVTGVFDNELLPVLSNGLRLFVQYEPTRVLLSTTFAADFDNDGDVDDSDLTSWESSFGVNGGADTDGDGDSDGADFLTWQQQLGAGLPIAGIVQAVPEPGNIRLALLGLGSLGAYYASYYRQDRFDRVSFRRTLNA